MMDLSSATTSVSFSEYVITLERSMRSTLMKVDEIRRRLFLLQESRRTSLSLDLDLTQLNVSQVLLRWRGKPLSKASPLDNTWHAYSARSTAQGNLLLFPNQLTRKMVVERGNKTTDTELVRWCLQIKQKSCGSENSFKQGFQETALDTLRRS